MRSYLLSYAAGNVGGLLNSLALWLAGSYGLTAALGVSIAPSLSPEWLYPRLVWGGLWGLLFAMPLLAQHWLRRALLLSLLPSATVYRLSLSLALRSGGTGTGHTHPAGGVTR